MQVQATRGQEDGVSEGGNGRACPENDTPTPTPTEAGISGLQSQSRRRTPQYPPTRAVAVVPVAMTFDAITGRTVPTAGAVNKTEFPLR